MAEATTKLTTCIRNVPVIKDNLWLRPPLSSLLGVVPVIRSEASAVVQIPLGFTGIESSNFYGK